MSEMYDVVKGIVVTEVAREAKTRLTPYWGVVHSLDPLTVLVDGESSAMPAINVVTSALRVGANVMCLHHAGSLIITGSADRHSFANYSALKTAMPNPPDGTPAWTTDGIDWRWRTALGKWAVVNTPVFDTAADRNAAIPEPTIGARSLIGSGATLSEQVYTGEGWLTSGATGTWLLSAATPVSAGAFRQINASTEISVDPGLLVTNSAGSITINAAGRYQMAATLVWNGGSAGRRQAVLTRDCPSIASSGVLSAGSVLPGGGHLPYVATSGLIFVQSVMSVPFHASAGTVLRVFAFTDTAVTVGQGSDTFHDGQTTVSLTCLG